jgi:hypothetical protein
MRVTTSIAKSLHSLEGAVYEEIARLVAARAQPEEIEALSDFLRAVKALQQRIEVGDTRADRSTPDHIESRTPERGAPKRSTPERDTPEAGGPSSRRPTKVSNTSASEFFDEGDALVRKGTRKAGAGHYLQRIPWSTVSRLAETIDSKYGSRAFHPAALSREARAPSYQTYAAINLFSDHGFLTSPKRGSFRRQMDIVIASTVDSLRAKLTPFTPDPDPQMTDQSV